MACKKHSSSDARDEGPARGPKGDAGALHPQIETAKQVVQWLAAGEAALLREQFDKAMLKAFPDDAAIAKWWQDAVKQTGKLRKQLSATQKTDGKFTSVIVTCVFANAPQDVQVLFNKRGQVAGLKVSASTNPDVRPQTPTPPFPYASKEVSYDNTPGGTKIAGTLTIPTGDGPHPAVLLISGSGSQDRDGTLSGHKLFLVIADHLSRRGFAVLRVDDRGVGGSTGDPYEETVETMVSDVEASLAFLKSQKSIDPTRMGLIGHSVGGGMVAPIVASRSADVAFVVSLAGPAASGVELIPVQVGALLKSEGRSADVVADIVAAHEKLAPLIAADAPASELEPAIAVLVKAAMRTLPGDIDPRIKKALQEHVRKQVLGPWHRSFAKAAPAQYLSRLTKPMLLMFGEKDVVVPADLNFSRAKQALAKAGNHNARVERLPGLNHLFQQAQTGGTDEYVMLTSTLDRSALDMMTHWLLETVGLDPK